jgi:ArsR family transcriptional regulator, zinc-responsive transcriptional repressor
MSVDVLMNQQRGIVSSDAVQDGALDLKEHLSTVAFVGKSLSDENRLRILLSLAYGKKTVSTIVEEMNLSQPLVSHHLKELRRSLLVNVERKGVFVYYEMADGRIMDIVRHMAQLAKDLLSKRDSF